MKINEFITESSKICPQCGMKGCTCEPGKCNCKPKPGYPKKVNEAANPAQQAAIAIAMKKAGKKPKNEGYAMEDEQVDGMAQGEIREIIRNAVKIKEKLDSGTSLDGWMYSYVTTSNDRLNSVAEQIGNPNIDEGELNEFAPGSEPGGGNYLKALASAWYNMDLEMLRHVIKQGKNAMDHHIDVQQTIEKMLERGIHCGDGKVRKYSIDYNSNFDGVEIQSHDHYEYADTDDAGNDIDERTGKPWGPYDVVEFHGNELDESMMEGENWSKYNHKRVGGMSKKSVNSYRRSHPGSKIQTAVTTKPSKLKKGSKAAKRRASFCARMRGMKKHRTSAKTANDPNSNINKSLRRWHCESIEQLQELVMLAEQYIAKHKKEVL